MKEHFKRLIPSWALPQIRFIYWKYFAKFDSRSISSNALRASQVLKCNIAYNKYGGYAIPASSRNRPAALVTNAGRVYEKETIEYVIKNCRDGDIVHAGAYFGDFLPAFSKSIGKNAKIWAFEPVTENFRCAQITLLLNDLSNVELIFKGLGAKIETRNIKTVDENGNALGGASYIPSSPVSNSETSENIHLTTIDETVGSDRDVAIIQLDIEGFEVDALKGGLETIRRCKPSILLSPTDNPHISEWFTENILTLGYRLTGRVHQNSIFEYGKINKLKKENRCLRDCNFE